MPNSNQIPHAENPQSYDQHDNCNLDYWRAHANGVNASRLLFRDQNPLIDLVISQEADKSNLRADKERALLLSNTDHLTGLYNRRGAVRAYRRLSGTRKSTERRSSQQNLSLQAQILVIDLDNFKSVNETHGYQAGDDLLVAVGAFMVANTRSDDIVARWGGDEFVIILPHTPRTRAFKIADDIRSVVKEGTTTTVSIGVGQVDLKRSLDETISMADAALANAKQNGKNVVIHMDDLVIDITSDMSSTKESS